MEMNRFRTALGGFHRGDVANYIEKSAQEFNAALRQLQEYYEKKLSSHSCADLIELTISLHRKRTQMLEQKRKFGAIDERYMKRAEDLLFGELSVALEIPKNEVRQYIAARLETV